LREKPNRLTPSSETIERERERGEGKSSRERERGEGEMGDNC